MRPPFQLSPEVRSAISEGRPVVALESALITHGLPHPANVKTAAAMEEAVRAAGSTPATIAVVDGALRIGLTGREIARLGSAGPERVRKCSRRDLAAAVAQGATAGTTVAATIFLAAKAGIPVMATGGIGGVHRGQPFDISADLIELGRTPIAVVCSGAKSILDLPLTLEVLETQGVSVVGFRTRRFPGFLVRDAGLPVDLRVETPAEAAELIAAARRIGSGSGILIASPIPKKHEFPRKELESSVAKAVAEARAEGVAGKAVTPFLLARLADLSAGASRKSNIALLLNNARLAGRIAAKLPLFKP